MEKVLSFFTETLSGTTYIVAVVIAVILFFACIGFLAERSIVRKKKEEQYVSASKEQSSTPVVEPVINSNIVEVNKEEASPINVNDHNQDAVEEIKTITSIDVQPNITVDQGVESVEEVKTIDSEIAMVIPEINQQTDANNNEEIL